MDNRLPVALDLASAASALGAPGEISRFWDIVVEWAQDVPLLAADTSYLATSHHGPKLSLEGGTPLVQPNPLPSGNDSEDPSFTHIEREAVGVLSTSATALQQVAFLLAREGVGVSRALNTGLHRGAPAMLEALRSLQGDPATEAITLIAQSPPSDSVRRILDHIRESDKPTVACFLGADQRLAWQAGAIPASRLDEAAMRAAAWVRGWDQALVSSRLEDQGEGLSATANRLRSRLGPGRRGLCGLFTSKAFYCEAQLTLSHRCQEKATISGPSLSLALKESVSQKLQHLRNALGDPALAVVLVDIVLSTQDDSELSDLLAALQQNQAAPIIITHVCGSASDLKRAAAQEARLRDAGIVVASSNAAAAYLAGSVIGRPSQGNGKRRRSNEES